MLRRSSILVAFLLVAASCGGSAAPTTTTTTSTSTTTTSTTTTSTTTTTTLPPTTTTTTDPPPTTTLPPDPRFSLLFDGFERYGVLGDDAETMIANLTEEFGEATADSGWIEEHGCSFDGPMRTITWIDPGFRVTFGDGVSDFGTGPHLVTYTTLLPTETPWRLYGVHRGMSIADTATLFPDAEILDGVGLDYVQFDPQFPSYAWVFESGEIRDFWGGVDYCRK